MRYQHYKVSSYLNLSPSSVLARSVQWVVREFSIISSQCLVFRWSTCQDIPGQYHTITLSLSTYISAGCSFSVFISVGRKGSTVEIWKHYHELVSKVCKVKDEIKEYLRVVPLRNMFRIVVTSTNLLVFYI